MRITVINGTEKHGVTYELKEIFLSTFRDRADITEYYLPGDCPNFCVGCAGCIFKGENTCKDADKMGAIEKSLLKADLIVMTSPAYVYHATGALMSDIVWDKLPEQRREMLTRKINRQSRKFARIDYAKPAHTNLITKIRFSFCRSVQKSIHRADPEYLDGKYWERQGWLGNVRPWK